jgi:hypothetical protein
MKRLIIIILLTTIWSATLCAQNTPYDMKDDVQVVKDKENLSSFLGNDVSERILTTSLIIGELVILGLVLFYWKRTRMESKESKKNIFKRNIKAIRDERIKPVVVNKYTSKRKQLTGLFDKKNVTGKIITSTAKKMSIAKGELFLAAKIQQLQEQSK